MKVWAAPAPLLISVWEEGWGAVLWEWLCRGREKETEADKTEKECYSFPLLDTFLSLVCSRGFSPAISSSSAVFSKIDEFLVVLGRANKIIPLLF